jgi:hypothetical protein
LEQPPPLPRLTEIRVAAAVKRSRRKTSCSIHPSDDGDGLAVRDDIPDSLTAARSPCADGWWDEWYDGGNGWEIPVANPVLRDTLEATALFELLGKSVAPLFYDQDAEASRRAWPNGSGHVPLPRAGHMVHVCVNALSSRLQRLPAALSVNAGSSAWLTPHRSRAGRSSGTSPPPGLTPVPRPEHQRPAHDGSPGRGNPDHGRPPRTHRPQRVRPYDGHGRHRLG